ncbi:tetratricopeptide repeat protein [Opitutus terrae]|uniref:Tetratricopeptide TPR_4 n=1 Tax=Opitutus terrae (strain DSM 11246 / JCM 15787 / PB90-1) TaxID=452637 RepID=B1ZSM7_OPITP|nr:tetratricopeptide repeat protein [Opitutus terrae]ACB73884.1 Tetratricopeptide TPR_4 [Opitutus terrae PB90-1]
MSAALEQTAAPAPRGGWLRWWPVMAAAVLIGLGAWGTAHWLEYRALARIQQSLPPLPALGQRPAVLGERLAQARAAALAGDRVIEHAAELGRLFHANGFHREAQVCWEALRSAQPRVARWSYYLADLRRTAGDQAGYVALLEETVARAPDYSPAWLQLAGVRFKSGEIDAAASAYQRRLALLPGDSYARLGLARVALHHQRTAEARDLIEQIVREDPKFPTSHNLYAEMLAADGNRDGARQQRWLARQAGRFREADDPWLTELNAWCFDPDRLFMLGTIDFQTERHQEARAFYEKAVQLAPEDAEAHALLGDLYLKQGDPARARDALEHSLRMPRPGKPPAMLFVNLSQAYRELHDSAQALAIVERGLREASVSFDLHNAHGIALADLGRHEEAIAAYRRGLATQRGNAEINFNLAISLLVLGRGDEAHAHLKQSLTLQPTFPKALALLGRMEMSAGLWREAEQYLRPLYEAFPEAPDSHQLLAEWELRAGSAASEQNDAAAAEGHFRAGLALAPEQPDLNLQLGVLLVTLGRAADAVPPFETYRRVRPEDPSGALFLGQTYAQLGRIPDARRVLAEGEQLATRAGNATTAQHCREILSQL